MELDIKSSTAEKLIDIGNDFLQKFAGPSAIEKGLIWGDNMKLRRLENQIKNFKKVKDIVEKENISIKQVNLKVLFPYLEGVSLEEDEQLQDLWANLFANYIDADKNVVVNVYPSILTQISTEEVKLLEEIYKNNHYQVAIIPAEFTIQFKPEILANLERLGLIIQEVQVLNSGGMVYDGMPDHLEQKITGNYFLTAFGTSFMNACKR